MLKKLYSILTKQEKLMASWLTILTIFALLFEVFGLAMIFPVISLLLGWANSQVCSMPLSMTGLSLFLRLFNWIITTWYGSILTSGFIVSAEENVE